MDAHTCLAYDGDDGFRFHIRFARLTEQKKIVKYSTVNGMFGDGSHRIKKILDSFAFSEAPPKQEASRNTSLYPAFLGGGHHVPPFVMM